MEPSATSTDPFTTTDMALASFLCVNGQTFRLEMMEGSATKALFVFEPLTEDERDDLSVLVERFRDGQARVEPLKFLREVANVRSRVYQFTSPMRRPRG